MDDFEVRRGVGSTHAFIFAISIVLMLFGWRWAGQVAALHGLGRRVILVSSGAIAEGMQRLGWSRRPHAMHELQAAAATAIKQ